MIAASRLWCLVSRQPDVVVRPWAFARRLVVPLLGRDDADARLYGRGQLRRGGGDFSKSGF